MSMNQRKFKKAIQNKSKLRIKNDSSDLLMYLIYIDYLNRLIKQSQVNGTISVVKLKQENKTLSKQYRG
ncbi:hypothetical protein PSN45_001100 [Yamadazyma tenuis]|uniref:Uncharacterized protein n=1 Tax=Candida tenuis (strain ATCC 10573 / BCRC 21748 / CBS 615 / JCM 9827 / NBRC 10315 / NRRL Y-1498 / VKM Y-70) TaxID=590646 RepID=G3B8C8_CANTC|nr:uncharacterized protein CANTEDRAFT_115827 [Yamadazyma tenuis ATCC 10573]EGV62366.1 hypothetical protein CANTEDRAFT_115827 [Yamadazyma tenuis ATCC 10573]WEJ93631.1 hypothetical protein PSN45_001100 [Yamadazyma tenuis]